MPLPDERPRQSVANLIGRFETQTKRQSLSATSQSRSSSVVSHVTGDSSKEELKDKREWPPKSVSELERPPIILPTLSSRQIPPALITQSSTAGSEAGLANSWKKDVGPHTEEAEIPLTAKALNASQRQAKGEPNSFLENWRKDLPSAQIDTESESTPTAPASAQSQVTPTPTPTQKFGTPPTPRASSTAKATKIPNSAVSKSLPSASSKIPSKIPPKSPAPKKALTPSTSLQALKPQHTGQSVASSAATARKPATKIPPTPKTPSRSEAAARSRTPTSARPKTPSSGLFAPTAASLARSRSAAQPMPAPVKKATISSTSMDRLSKPTAASKARVTSTPPPAPSRSAAPSAPRATAKVKAPTTPSKLKKASSAPLAAGAAVASIASLGLAAAASESVVVEDVAHGAEHDNTGDSEVSSAAEDLAEHTEEDSEHTEETSEHTEETSEHTEETSEHTEEPVEHIEELTEHNEITDDFEELSAPTEEVHVQEVQPTEHPESFDSEDDDATPVSPSPVPEAVADSEISPVDVDAPEHTPSVSDQGKNDLEDIVNLLESVKLREDSIPDISDEILEIPDEEEK